jgi:Beta-propeller repeat
VGSLGNDNVVKFDAVGHRLWAQRIDGFPSRVATDKSGNAFVGGVTFDGEYGVSLAKLDGAGALLWTRELPLGGASDEVSGVATDHEGNVYLAGSTDTSEAGYSGPGWVYKFDPDGGELWTWGIYDGDRHRARGVATDEDGNAYVVGYSAPSPFLAPNQGGLFGEWLIKFGAGGDTLWGRQIGMEGDTPSGVATDEHGNVYVTGARFRNGSSDVRVAEYGPAGRLRWQTQFGTANDDLASAVAVASGRAVYVAGSTSGRLGGPPRGGWDAFVAELAGRGR